MPKDGHGRQALHSVDDASINCTSTGEGSEEMANFSFPIPLPSALASQHLMD